MANQPHQRFHVAYAHLASPFGGGAFGAVAESIARFFGTPQYLVGQTVVVLTWIVLSSTGFTTYDPYPFILLNLAFSTQAAYAAPLILLAETRQADRDKAWTDADARHREELAETTYRLLEQNTALTAQVESLAEQIAALTREIHGVVVRK